MWDDGHFDATIISLRYVTANLRLILLKDFEYVSLTKALQFTSVKTKTKI